MRSTVWFKIFNQPQNGFKWSFSPLNLFISWIRLFLTVTYFVGFYVWQILREQPEINIFGAKITAVVEFIQCAVILPCRHGCEYMESAVSILARLAGTFVPGLAVVVAHSPRNYVNAVRLGPRRLSRRTPNSLSKTLRSVYFYLLELVVRFLGYLCPIVRWVYHGVKRKILYINSLRPSVRAWQSSGPSQTDDRPWPDKNGITFCLFDSYSIFEVTFFYLIYLSYFLLSRQTLLKM